MRIISGLHKGRRILTPKNLPVRPTTDKAKEALFNILIHNYDFVNRNALDLFAGTGSISYEFASRGMSEITAVDQNYLCVNFITKTSNNLSLPINVFKQSVEKFLKHQLKSFDFIFADPPYSYTLEQYYNLINLIFTNSMQNKNGLFIIEHTEKLDLSSSGYFIKSKNYGGCVFSFFAH